MMHPSLSRTSPKKLHYCSINSNPTLALEYSLLSNQFLQYKQMQEEYTRQLNSQILALKEEVNIREDSVQYLENKIKKWPEVSEDRLLRT